MDPSLKVSLMNHCVICLRKVGDGEGKDEEEVKFEFGDSPSFLASLNELWRILKGNQNSEGLGISLTTVMKAKGQSGGGGGDGSQRSMINFSEAPTLCHYCGDKVINVDSLMKAARQQVREVQLLWIKSRSKVHDGGRRLKKLENYLEESGLGRGGIQSAFQFMGISQIQPTQDKDDKIRQLAVVRLHRIEVPVKLEPVDIQDEDEVVPLQLTPATSSCKQSRKYDEDSSNLLENDWSGMDDQDDLGCSNSEQKYDIAKPVDKLDNDVERGKRKAERERQQRAMIRERGPLTEEDFKKREEQKKKNVERIKARMAAAAAKLKEKNDDEVKGKRGSPSGKRKRLSEEKKKRRTLEYDRARISRLKDKPLTAEQLKRREEQRKRKNESKVFQRLEKTVRLENGLLTEEQIKEKERLRQKEIERNRLRKGPVGYDKDGKPIYTAKQLEWRRKESERMKLLREKEKLNQLTPEQMQKRLEEKRRNAERAKLKRMEKKIQGFTPEEMRKHEEYNAKRNEKRRLVRERIRQERGSVPRKIDKK